MLQDKYDALLAKYRRLLADYQRLHRQKQRKKQFSKCICVFGLMLVFMALTGNFALLLFGRKSMSEVTVAVITCFGGFATGGYFALCAVRDCSKNKYGIREE